MPSQFFLQKERKKDKLDHFTPCCACARRVKTNHKCDTCSSLVPRPSSSHANIYAQLFLITSKRGECLVDLVDDLDVVLDVLRLKAMPSKTQNLEREAIYPLKISKVGILAVLCVDYLQKVLSFLGPVEMTQTVMKRSLLVFSPGFTYFLST